MHEIQDSETVPYTARQMFDQMFKMAMETLAYAFTNRAKDLYGK